MNIEWEKSLLISIAAMLHDVGKVLQRAGSALSDEYKRDGKIYELVLGSKDSHYHAAYSAFFMDEYIKDGSFLREKWKEHFNTDIMVTSASHHEPSNSNIPALIIQKADWISSGLDRDDYEKRESDKSYKDVTMASILNAVRLYETESCHGEYRHNIIPFSSESIFPKGDEETVKNYAACLNDFENGFKLILDELSKTKDLYRFAFALDTLCLRTMMYIPASTWSDWDEVSLYDHSKTTAAYACALWQYNCCNEKDDIKDNDTKKFLVIRGEFFGIQSFIFNKEQSSKNPSKILRGKSFYVSLLTEAAVLILIKELGLTPFNIMFNAAGAFAILAGNTDEVKKRLNEAEKKITEWLYNEYYGTVSFGISKVEAAANDITKEYFRDNVWLKLLDVMDRVKLSKFNLPDRAALFKGYIDKFNNKAVCSYCGIEPVGEDGESCEKCSKMIALGDNLAKKNTIYFYEDENGLLGKISYHFDGKKPYFLPIDINMDNGFNGVFQHHYKSYVQKDNDEVKSFEELAGKQNILGIFKADVDNLGSVFAFGLDEDDKSKITFSRINAMSRAMHYFFSYYISELAQEKEYDIYTVFAGGDDLFIIGYYKDIVKLGLDIADKFSEYTGYNPELTLSAGIAFAKPGTPVWYMADRAEAHLEGAKSVKGKGSLALFEYAGHWEDFKKGYEDFDKFIKELPEETASTGFYYKLLDFADMSIKYKSGKNPKYLMWRSRLSYMLGRLFGKESADKRENICVTLTNWIEAEPPQPQLLKALISLKLYENRGVKNE